MFSCSCCHPNKFRGNKPKENLPVLKRKSSSSCLIHLYSPSSGLHSASIHHLDYCVTAALALLYPWKVGFLKSFHLHAVQKCPEELWLLLSWVLWGAVFACHHSAALQELSVTCSAPQTLHVFARVSVRAWLLPKPEI